MNLSKLILLLEELEASCDTCNRCGMCQSVCPVFRETGREGDVARGKIALIEGLRREILTRPDRVLERLNRCLLCGACQRTCSRKVDLMNLFLESRTIISGYLGLPPYKKLIFRVIMIHPSLFDAVIRVIARVQGFLNTPAFKKTWIRIAKVLPLLKGRNILRLPGGSFRSALDGTEEATAASVKDKGPAVLFFTGCLIDKMMPEVGRACLMLFARAGIQARVLKNEACCGIPALASGDRRSFDDLVELNVSQMWEHDFDVLVTACATCTMTIRDLWPRMADSKNSSLRDAVSGLKNRTLDISEYLLTRTSLLNDLKSLKATGQPAVTVTYHEPCHLKQNSRAGKLIRELLSSLPGFRYVEMKDPDLCCGQGGSFNLSHYDLSKKIGEKKAVNIVGSGAQIVVTSCPACMMQLKDMLAQAGSGVQVRHITEILADVLEHQTSDGK